ncbi:Methyltransferase domain-containing protein [Marininema mesophilum]|uniref:Methyltransferase domain-containing protein n=1 Tax=Marininema mesophilum TaxID=1048340 RepID=A0A1H2ZZY6_9BACL|nr:class I SAM-dependent methyltransferase [Marininema mesophilum]SDX22548.1 Methyltransferase domain-containing protein [Marininema mesophilum]
MKHRLAEQYRDDRQLELRRQIHLQYSLSPVPFVDWTLDKLPLRGDERILDAGCGSGGWLFPMANKLSCGGEITGLDLSPGMIEGLRKKADQSSNIHLVISDLQTLPFKASSFDIVMANFCLYHVPNINQAIAELYRVLRPGGYLMAATGSLSNYKELTTIDRECRERWGFPLVDEKEEGYGRFSLENGDEYLRQYFGWSERYILDDVLVFLEAEPIIDYYASGMVERGGTSAGQRTTLITDVNRIIRHEIDTRSSFTLRKSAGFFLAQKLFN